MKIMQMTKRIFLLVAVNILVMTTITLVLGLFGAGRYFPQGGARWPGHILPCLGLRGRVHFPGALAADGQVDDGSQSDPAQYQ